VSPIATALLEHDLKNVGSRFGFLGILGRGSLVDQVGDGRDVEVVAEFVLLGGGSDGNPCAGIAHASKQIGDRGEGADQRQVLGLETRAAPFLHFLAVVPPFVSRKKYGNELVAALPDLTSELFETDVVTELRHRFVPGERVQIGGVQQSRRGRRWRLSASMSSGARSPDFRIPAA
jgi:hypothetical protein